MKTVHRKGTFAKKIGMSERHLERLIAAGLGPPITELGERTWGVTDDDGDAWLAARRRLPPGWIDPPITDDHGACVNEASARTEARQRSQTSAQ
jgi:hypothetical protein